ncbi:flagellar hook-basal body complex protein [Limnohabitans sp. Rim8]|uniref:flagellar hook-basal body complex protein n=1 Tax=Limnohabitans sp. Rim8 TaxID=1100718 RepID=UPI0025DCFC1E|nr:flagellar hook-basal body complex protein [Limnohabitans sp. Rim8]
MSFYTSLTGLNSATAQLAVTSNNIANVGTSGFKRSRADFGDIFSTSPLQKSSSNIGQGVSLKQVSQEFSQGNISTSGNSLDLAITGDGFFPLKTADGLQDIYTRNGSFTLNDQNNVVNSTGQRLMAASVDSSGKADLTDLNALSIPPKTSGEAVETTKIQLGLNLPADSAVITSDFDRSNPSTYNKSTALTVYDSGGNGYLATVYYAKTQNATLDSPFSKWQTYFFVGDTQVKPALQQATDTVGGALFVNKYGDVLPKSDSRVIPSSGTTEMYSLDQLTDTRQSSPATALGGILPSNVYNNGALTGATGTLSFNIAVDSGIARPITYTLKAADSDPEVLARNIEVEINNVLGALADTPDNTATANINEYAKNARYGITVSFDPDSARFSVASGTTGDTSNIAITGADTKAAALMGLADAPNLIVTASGTQALRGKPSEPAMLTSEVLTINTAKSIQVTSSNKDFFVSVDGIAAKVELPFPTTFSNIDGFTKALQDKINSMVDPESGRKVSGVTVAFDPKTKQLNFTTGTTGSNSTIQVSGAADWGLANTEMQFGATTDWKKLSQFTENGALQFVKNGEQTEDGEGVSDKTEWWPIYLDRGELSFDLTGKPVSPLTGMPFETAFLQGGKGALTMSIDFTKSTQYSSAFAVLSQSQDGAPEGELMGLNINPDGLVNATYSNGSQVSLGKIVLANFSSPSGLRQVGDASYLSSASSGMAKIGEAGSAGFGSIRAGATERANVDLTQELVDLITAQRNFQANAKAIETSSTMTSAIINIRS